MLHVSVFTHLILFGEAGVAANEDPHHACVAVPGAGVQWRVPVLKVTESPSGGNTTDTLYPPPQHLLPDGSANAAADVN